MTTLFIILSVLLLVCAIIILTTGIKLYKRDNYKPMLYTSVAFSVYIFIDLLIKVLRFAGVL